MKTKRLCLLIFIILHYTYSFSQKDTLLQLGINQTILSFYNSSINNLNSPYNKKTQNKSSLVLPFVDDFSQHRIFPNPDLWEDMNVYVNSNFADKPITYGVATFDGLDSTGYPYIFSNQQPYGVADYLTSKPIDLSNVVDSVFLSFLYQPEGNGDVPESEDSLNLEFFRSSDNTWVRVWGVPGVKNHPFRKVMIPVDVSFQNTDFKFRFKNWATLSGSLDHWNIDYVYLNDERNYNDTAIFDISFITNYHNMLKEFSSMPWSHYKVDSLENMKTNLDVTYKNNDNTDHQIFWKYQITDNNGTGPVVETYPNGPSSRIIKAFSEFTEPHAVLNSPANDFYFTPDTDKTKVFQIKNYFHIQSNLKDDILKNDTVTSYQVFASHYAYDDGSAEFAFSLNGSEVKLAHEFEIKKSDTLTSFQVYFSPLIGENASNLNGQTFRLKVWSSLSPEVEIYSQSATLFTEPIYTSTNEFSRYNLDTPLYLTAGTYYFGWEQITKEFLGVGWDVNTNNKTKVHFNTAGIWESTSRDGSLMLRPTFGNLSDPTVNINEMEETRNDFNIYPNPSSGIINFELAQNLVYNSYHIELINLHGKSISETESTLSRKIDVRNVSNGVYMLRFTNNATSKSILKKVIIYN